MQQQKVQRNKSKITYFFVPLRSKKIIKVRTVFFITALLLIISCGEKMQPNQDLNLAFEYIKKGDFVTARTLADNAPQENAAGTPGDKGL